MWRVSRDGAQDVPSLVVLREWVEVENGDFGVESECRYRILLGGTWTVVRLVERSDGKGGHVVEQVKNADGTPMAGTFTGPDGRPFQNPPVEWCSGSTSDGFGEGDVPLLQMAELNIEHLQKRSDQSNLSHKLAMPGPWVKTVTTLWFRWFQSRQVNSLTKNPEITTIRSGQNS